MQQSAEANHQLSPDQIEKANLSPIDFAEVASRGWYKRAPHLDLLNQKLLDCAEGRTKRLMVFMPPRHSKSESISHFLPPWWLGKRPDDNIILVSYAQDWADHWGRAARDEVEEYGKEVFGIEVRDDSSAAGRWQVEGHRGGFKAAGIGGSITGRGANLMIIDDPVKNAQEAWSVTIQARNDEWWRSTARTRLEPDAVVILMMTRWHQADLAGQILAGAAEDEEWEILELPALAGPDDALGREPGEALWPERYDEAELKKIKQTVGEYYWQAEFQQKPQLPEGFLYFNRHAVEYGKEHIAEVPMERVDTKAHPGAPADGYVLIWERPRTGERYYAGVDTADGKGEAVGAWSATGGADRNCCAIYRARDDVQVAEIYGRQEEHVFARTLNEWGRSYNNCDMLIETNRRSVMVAMRELNYPNLLYTEKPSDMHVMAAMNPQRRLEYGWNTNTQTRPILLSDFREAVSAGAVKIKSEATYEEMLSFVEGDPPQAAPGTHDDRIFAHALSWQARRLSRQQRRSNQPAQSWGNVIKL